MNKQLKNARSSTSFFQVGAFGAHSRVQNLAVPRLALQIFKGQERTGQIPQNRKRRHGQHNRRKGKIPRNRPRCRKPDVPRQSAFGEKRRREENDSQRRNQR